MSSILAKPSRLLSIVLGILLVLFGADIYFQKQTLQTLVGEMTAQQSMIKKLSEQMQSELKAMAVKPKIQHSPHVTLAPKQRSSYQFDQRVPQQQNDQSSKQLKSPKQSPSLPHPKSDLEILEALSMDDATGQSDLKFDLDENLQTKINGQHITDPEAGLIDSGKGSQIKIQYSDANEKDKNPTYIKYQVASSSDPKNASDFCKKLKQDQYNCSVKAVAAKGKKSYKVIILLEGKNTSKAVQYFDTTHHVKIFKVS
ncbi:hypothetical protein N9Y17_02180 [Gammaproteobacteria bacterium]|nr:hypothetical protein [Gammaproteobacteria bacterium]